MPSGKKLPLSRRHSIDVYIRRLREKIEPDPRYPQYLKTLRGIGYYDSKSQNRFISIQQLTAGLAVKKRANLVAARPCRIGAGT